MSPTNPVYNARGAQATAICVVFTSLSFLFVALRAYTRGIIVRNFGPEDWLIVGAWLIGLIMTVFMIRENYYGNGLHVQDVDPANTSNILQSLYISIILYQLSLVLAKVSILWQYYRIFTAKGMRITIYIMLGVCVAFLLWSVFNNAFMCTPVAFFWDKTVPGGHCISQQMVWWSNGAINIMTDIIIFILPMPVLRQLHLPRKQKIALLFIFALGGLVCVVSILRLPQLRTATVSVDPTYDDAPIAYWSNIEVNVALICACLPTLKAFVARYFPRLISGRQSDHSDRKATPMRGTHLRTKGAAVAKVEHFENKTFQDGSAAPGQIQVVTVVEQDRDDADSRESPESMGARDGRRLSREQDMV